jgi:hypothetical protein
MLEIACCLGDTMSLLGAVIVIIEVEYLMHV